MNSAVAGEVAAQLGAKTRVVGSAMYAVVPHGDAFLAVRARDQPVGEVFVTMQPLDGFELRIRWGDRRGDPDVGDDELDRLFGLTTNDQALATWWLDDIARRAVIGSIYEYWSDFESAVLRRAWTYELRDGELTATKGAPELTPAGLARAITTACAIAARSHRWAADYATLARGLGGRAHGALELGGAPIVTVTRDAVYVAVRVLRRVPGAEPRLRTQLQALRAGVREGELGLVARSAPPAARLPVPEGPRHALEGYRLRATATALARKLDADACKLLAAADPVALAIRDAVVELWLDGAPRDHSRLDAAVSLVARLAVDAPTRHGPYR